MAEKLRSTWIQLDCNISDDEKIFDMEFDLGPVAFAIYVKIILKMRMTTNLQLQHNPKKIAKLIGYPSKYNIVQQIIENYGAFIIENGYFYSARMRRDVEYKEEITSKRTESGSKGADKRWHNDSNPDSKLIANEWQSDSKDDSKDDSKLIANEIAKPIAKSKQSDSKSMARREEKRIEDKSKEQENDSSCSEQFLKIAPSQNTEKEVLEKEKDALQVYGVRDFATNTTTNTQPKEVEDYVITLILNDKSEFGITKKQVEIWSELYPAVDVMQELRNMKGWCLANLHKRKTKSGILKFINNWLTKEQNKGGNNFMYQNKSSPPMSREELQVRENFGSDDDVPLPGVKVVTIQPRDYETNLMDNGEYLDGF